MRWNLPPERYDEIREEVANLIEDFGISVYPFSIWKLLRNMGIRLVPYSALDSWFREELIKSHPYAITLSPKNFNVAFTTIYYNDDKGFSRKFIRFTLAHELAHLILEHPDTGEKIYEHEANFFANYLLVPAPLVLRDSSIDYEVIEFDFQVSHRCAMSAYDRTAKRKLHGPRRYTEYEHRILKTAHLTKKGGEAMDTAPVLRMKKGA